LSDHTRRETTEDSPKKGDAPGLALAAAVVVVGLAVFLTWFTWAKWGDAVIDVGRELEIAWKLSEGELLYRDAAYNYGPLSPYFNAMLLKTLGTDVASLVTGGLLSVGLGAWLVYLLSRRFLARVASAAIVIVFLFECAFQHYLRNGSFNFVLPYSFPAVHGMLLALGAVLLAFGYIDGKGRNRLVMAGVLAGLSLLCKIEVAAAAVIALAAATTLFGRRAWKEPAASALDTLAWGIPAAVIVVLGYLPFVLATSMRTVFAENIFRPDLVDVRSSVFFLNVLGLQDAGGSLKQLLYSCLFWGGGILLLRLAVFIRRRIAVTAVGLAIVGVSWFVPVLPDTLYRCLPLVALIVLAAGLLRPAEDRAAGRTAAAGAVLAAFAFLALGRILFNAGPHHYGFYLSVPALVVLGVCLARLLPGRLRLGDTMKPVFTALVLAFMVCQSARDFTKWSAPRYTGKTLELRGVNGRMMAHTFRPRYRALQEALDFLAEHGGQDKTLLVIPEGAGANFLTGLRNPTSYNLFTPPELNAPGVEERLIEQIERSEVDWVLITDRQVNEYGYTAPGVDYALDLFAMLKRDYAIAKTFGKIMPFSHPKAEGGAILLERIRE
jgi:hypothetical protein